MNRLKKVFNFSWRHMSAESANVFHRGSSLYRMRSASGEDLSKGAKAVTETARKVAVVIGKDSKKEISETFANQSLSPSEQSPPLIRESAFSIERMPTPVNQSSSTPAQGAPLLRELNFSLGAGQFNLTNFQTNPSQQFKE